MVHDNSIPYSFTKNGIYYFERRVPGDLQRHDRSAKITCPLRTRSAPVAASRARRAAEGVDQASEASVTLSEAVEIYLRLKGQNRPVNFQRAAHRCCGYVIDVCGDKELPSYTRADATRFRDALVERRLTVSSIIRVFGTVRSVVNFAASETGITLTTPFSSVYYDRHKGVKGRHPMPIDALRNVQNACREIDDELRWLVALVSDTGMRLAEAAGLSREDFSIDDETPHVVVREHPRRRLKTLSSNRVVPLVGESLWAAHPILAHETGSGFAFPRYNSARSTNANSASAALNKWMKPMVPEGCTMHSFRHSIRDR